MVAAGMGYSNAELQKRTPKLTFSPANAVLWAEIPVRDIERSIAFYNEVFGFGLTRQEGGRNPISFIQTSPQEGVSAHFYPGTPARDGSGPTVHLAVPDALEKASARFEAAGGTLKSPIIDIPAGRTQLPNGRFCYAIDPDGNSIALFESEIK